MKMVSKSKITSYKHFMDKSVQEKEVECKGIVYSELEHKRHGFISIMCLKCFNIFNTFISTKYYSTMISDPEDELFLRLAEPAACLTYCKYCNTDHPHFTELDYNISEVISKLNKKGYRTLFSCEGHKEDNEAYIYFMSNNILKYTSMLPISWNVDLDNLKENKVIIRSSYENFDEAMNDIRDFVDSLPELYTSYKRMGE